MLRTALLTLALAAPLAAQPAVPLVSETVRLVRLAPEVAAATETIDVPAGTTALRLAISATETLADVEVSGPSGPVGGSSGVTVDRFEVSPGQGAPGFPPGPTVLVTVPAPAPGPYAVTVATAAAPAGEVAVVVRASFEGGPGLSAFSTARTVLVGTGAGVSAALFDGPQPIRGATVEGTVLGPDGAAAVAVALRDDGQGPDAAAGDGLYSALVRTPAVGVYGVAVTARGTHGGTPLSLTGAALVRSVPRRALIDAVGGGTGIDPDNDGDLDGVQIDVEVGAADAGPYGVYAEFVGAGGASVVA